MLSFVTYWMVLLFLTFGMSANAKTKKPNINKQIHELCMQRFPRTVDKRKQVCDCVVNNYAQKVGKKELEFIYKFLESKKEPEKMNDKETMLIEYSNDVSEKCINDPNWVVNQDEPIKE